MRYARWSAKRPETLMRRIPRKEREEAAKLIREAIDKEHLARLRAEMDADPNGWAAMYHFGGGRDVRNLLRMCGYTEKWAQLAGDLSTIDIVLDQIWAPLVELAMKDYEPPPGMRRRSARQVTERRWRAMRRAYCQATKTDPSSNESEDTVEFIYERMSIDPERVAALKAMVR